MRAYIGQKLFVFISISLLSGCGLWEKEALNIEGERITIVGSDVTLTPDYALGQTKIKLPAPHKNIKWTQNGGNSLHLMGHIKAAEKLKKLWSMDIGKGASKRDQLITSPIIAYDVVFAIDADGIVTARRLDNGKQIWKRRLKPQNKEEKSVSLKGAGIAEFNKKIYATTGFGEVFCLDMMDGKILWRKNLNMPIRIAPTIGSGRLIVQSFDNTLYVLDAENGEEIWKNKTDYETTTLVGGATPAYDAKMDVIVAAFSNGELHAFKASTGTPLWSDMLVSHRKTNSLSSINTIKANPVIDGNKVFAVGYNSVLVAIDLRTGIRVWEKELGSTNQPWVVGDYLYVLTNNFELLAINKQNGKIIWNTIIPKEINNDEINGAFANGPILANNRLLVTSSSGYIFAISPYTGEILNYVSVDEGINLSPVIANETIVFLTNDAEMIAYK